MLKSFFIFCFSALTFLFCIFGPMATAEASSLEKDYIIGYEEDHYIEEIEESGVEVVENWQNIDAAAVSISEEDAENLSQQEGVTYIEEDALVQSNAVPLKNWGLARVNASDNWNRGYRGKGVKVAVVDTGVNTSHPALNIKAGFSSVPYTKSFNDDSGHGTHAAGIISANLPSAGLMGVAPESELYAVKVLDNKGDGAISQVVSGIDWAISQNVDVINMSLGTTTNSNALRDILQKAASRNIYLSAAAGNTGRASSVNGNIEFPAKYESVIAVGSVNNKNERAGTSSTGPQLELAAPGVSIQSTYFPGNTTAEMSGTSMAAPFVSGSLVLLKQAYPDESFSDARKRLHRNAQDLGTAGRDSSYGYGLLKLPALPTMNNASSPAETFVWPAVVNETIQFSDISAGFWAANDIYNLSSRGIITGRDNVFSPNQTLKRSQALTILGRLQNWNAGAKTTPFTDVPASYYASGYISYGAQTGYLNGFPDGTFKPNAEMTRGQVAAVLDRVYQFSEPTTSSSFTDVTSQTTGSQAIEYLAANRIINGYPDGTFRPNAKITRAQFTKIINLLGNHLTEEEEAAS